MTDIFSPNIRSNMMSRIRGKDTKPELIVRKAVYGAGYRYRLHQNGLPGCPDIVLNSRRIAIFVHGCFWHAHSGCKYFKLPESNRRFWEEKLNANKERDHLAVRRLHNLGWKVITIWECSLRQESRKKNTLEKLLRAISYLAADDQSLE